MANSSLTESSTTTFHKFNDLPQEIKDIVLSHGFGTKLERSKIIWRKEWNDRENKRRSEAKSEARIHRFNVGGEVPSYAIVPFPGCPLDKMGVSRQFYKEAVKIWAEGAIFEFGNVSNLRDFIDKANRGMLQNIREIHTGYRARTSIFSERFCQKLSVCLSLRKLIVVVNEGMDLFEGKSDYTEELNERDFRHLEIVRDISRTTSIQTLEILPGKHDYAESPAELEQYRRNLAKLSEHILKQLQARRSMMSQQASTDGKSDMRNNSQACSKTVVDLATENKAALDSIRSAINPLQCRPAAIQNAAEASAQRNENSNKIGGHSQINLPRIRLGDYVRNDRALESQTFDHDALQPRTSLHRRFQSIRVSKKETILGILLLINTIGTGIAFYLAANLL